MKLISHRGNLSGPNPETENTPEAVDGALRLGFDVEVDVWVVGEKLFLGHDFPSLEIEESWVNERRQFLWIHCKNADALSYFVKRDCNCFFHDVDAYTLTLDGYVWAYPGMPASGEKCIAVMPEYITNLADFDSSKYFGVCSDHVLELRKEND